MRNWLTFDLDFHVGEPRHLCFVGVDARDNTRLELVALASELSTLALLACEDVQRLPASETQAALAAECARLRGAADEVLSDAAKSSRWPLDDLEHAQMLFRRHLADATVLRERAAALARRPSAQRRAH